MHINLDIVFIHNNGLNNSINYQYISAELQDGRRPINDRLNRLKFCNSFRHKIIKFTKNASNPKDEDFAGK